VQDMEALEEAALNKIGLDDEVESALSDDTLLFTDEDVADKVDVGASTKAPTVEQESAGQVSVGPQSSAGSHRDSAEMDKIRKILDDLA